MAMSVAALAMMFGHIAIYGPVHDADEGTAAHLFQILMAAQALAVVYFALRWLPKSPRQALGMLGVQISVALVPLGVVFVLDRAGWI